MLGKKMQHFFQAMILFYASLSFATKIFMNQIINQQLTGGVATFIFIFNLASLFIIQQTLLAVIMNDQRHLTRWNRFAIKKAKQATPQPNQNQLSACFNKQNIKGEHSNDLGSRSQLSKTKDKLALTTRYQNRQAASTSNTTKSHFPHHPYEKQTPNRSKSKLHTQNSLSLTKRIPQGKEPQSKHKINYSILQRIHKTLEHHPSISNQCKSPYKKHISFATRQQDQESELCDKQIINLNKLVLWRESKLLKTTERIYQYLMDAQVHDNSNSNDDTTIVEGNYTLKREMKNYLMQRYKTSKLCLQNFINLCYSLYYYTDKALYEQSIGHQVEQRIKLRMLLIFQKFINLEYNEDDLIFYLYSRNIFSSILKKQSKLEVTFVSLEQIRTFLNILSNGDLCIFKYYQTYLIRTLKDKHQYEVHSILYHLLSNFQTKKSRASQTIAIATSKPAFFPKEESKTSHLAYDQQFWKTQPPACETIQQQLYDILLEQMGVQTKKLMSYFQHQFSSHKQKAAELILIKAIRMLNTVHMMDKYKWFQEMQLVKDRILMAKNEDFAEIELLHCQLRSIQQHYHCGLQRKIIIQFSKKLLTAKAFVNKLQQLFQIFDNDTTMQ